MFYLPHTSPTSPQLIYFPFLILLFIFNFLPQFFIPSFTILLFPSSFLKSHLLHNFIIFPPCPPHFYCFPSSLIWTRAFRLVNAQSVQFSKITKKLKIDLCQFFSHWKEALFSLKSGNKKWGSPYSFLRRSCRKCAPHSFSPILERGLGRVSQYHVC